jgi:hypothetical protein
MMEAGQREGRRGEKKKFIRYGTFQVQDGPMKE